MTLTINAWWIPAILTIALVMWPIIIPYRPSGMFDIDMRGFVILPVFLLVWLLFFAIMYFAK